MLLFSLLSLSAAVFFLAAIYILTTRETPPTYRAADFLKRFPRCQVCRKVHVRVNPDGIMIPYEACDLQRLNAVLGTRPKWRTHPERPDNRPRHVIPFEGPVS